MGGGSRGAEVRDCQWWVRRVVGELVARGLLVGDERLEGREPEVVVNGLPVH